MPCLRLKSTTKKIGAYLSERISRRYPSRRQFCIAYICAVGEEPIDDRVNTLTNRFSKICQGKNSVQTHDLPFLSPPFWSFPANRFSARGMWRSPVRAGHEL